MITLILSISVALKMKLIAKTYIISKSDKNRCIYLYISIYISMYMIHKYIDRYIDIYTHIYTYIKDAQNH